MIAPTVEAVLAALHDVIDPEIGYNIVDLGLVYDVAIDERGAAAVVMTTTSPGCPATTARRRARANASRSSPASPASTCRWCGRRAGRRRG
jgi:metal-sulfur cluster biosynthetic enzyme